AGRARQELAQRNEIGIGGVIQPFAADDELVPEISQMRNRAAEGGKSELEENPEDLAEGALCADARGGRRLHPCSTSLNGLSRALPYAAAQLSAGFSHGDRSPGTVGAAVTNVEAGCRRLTQLRSAGRQPPACHALERGAPSRGCLGEPLLPL